MSWHQRAGVAIAVEVNRFMKVMVDELDKGKVGWIIYLGLFFSIVALVWYLVAGTSLVVSAALGMLVVIFIGLGLFYPVWRWLR